MVSGRHTYYWPIFCWEKCLNLNCLSVCSGRIPLTSNFFLSDTALPSFQCFSQKATSTATQKEPWKLVVDCCLSEESILNGIDSCMNLTSVQLLVDSWCFFCPDQSWEWLLDPKNHQRLPLTERTPACVQTHHHHHQWSMIQNQT